MTTLDPLVKRQLQTQHRPDMPQKAKVNELERKANMKRASLTELGREIDLARDCGCSLTTEKADDVTRGFTTWGNWHEI
jgi:hypothetical protein